jgi:hypothetical protein
MINNKLKRLDKLLLNHKDTEIAERRKDILPHISHKLKAFDGAEEK